MLNVAAVAHRNIRQESCIDEGVQRIHHKYSKPDYAASTNNYCSVAKIRCRCKNVEVFRVLECSNRQMSGY